MLHNNGKRTEISNETNKILTEEKTINIPIIEALIDNSINLKIQKMQKQLNDIHKKYEKALKNLNTLKGKAWHKYQSHLAKNLGCFLPPCPSSIP